ncbi:MAG: SGNH/GDSL hydrolase family protein [Mojavia pulchra JT2-VF2]|jgi:phospholipase/lecithinase/hemolysin|uniref:SGNH/GDSL hydrolase family protein n=1 Tax=Mojavia pulchra JT2-VF2 TaxID=287848 RepID=A0A951PWP0_9NOST|nr:SGNH/GDSL hydrolase family protein [Mojavia pulchra JT2-VF2]
MKKEFVAAGFVIFTFMLPLKATAAQFSGIYVFGDSLSDTGNIYNALGETYPPSPPYFEGRFSNGQIWVDYLADQLKLKTTLVTDLVPDLDFTKLPNTTLPTQGVNFAFGGASSGLGNAVFPNSGLPGVQAQVQGFAANLQAKNQMADPDALYTVWGGANDFIFTNPQDSTTPLNNISQALNTLTGAGAKNILVFNLPDLSKIPFEQSQPQEVRDTLQQSVNTYNSALKQTLDDLSNNPNLNIISVDVNSLFEEATTSPDTFGFTNVTDPCLKLTSPTTYITCPNPDKYLFWDDVHPTTATHKVIADRALAAINAKSVPEPSTALGTLAIGAWGAASVLKRKRKQPLVTTASLVPDAQSTHIKVES